MTQNYPFFSVIIPTYNRAHTLSKAISSVLAQIETDFELIIMDDGSTDETAQLVKSLNDQRVKYFFQQNQERSRARNNAFAKSTGKYICFLDSDDEYLPTHLSSLRKNIELQNHPVAMFYTDCLVENEETGLKQEVKSPLSGENPLSFFLLHSVIPDRVCLHHQILKKYSFDPEVRIGEDTLLWSRICGDFPVYHVAELSICYKIHDENTVHIRKNVFADRLKGLKELFKEPAISKRLERRVKNKVYSVCYYGIARHYKYHHSFIPFAFYTLLSVMYQPFSPQTKSKLYEIVQFLSGKNS